MSNHDRLKKLAHEMHKLTLDSGVVSRGESINAHIAEALYEIAAAVAKNGEAEPVPVPAPAPEPAPKPAPEPEPEPEPEPKARKIHR
jgi:outer membrane biosynthesis protein TonB